MRRIKIVMIDNNDIREKSYYRAAAGFSHYEQSMCPYWQHPSLVVVEKIKKNSQILCLLVIMLCGTYSVAQPP